MGEWGLLKDKKEKILKFLFFFFFDQGQNLFGHFGGPKQILKHF